MIDSNIARIRTLFIVLFVLLFVRQGWVMIVEGPQLARDEHNPRTHAGVANRGAILATDGTKLAYSVGEKRRYPLANITAQAVGYVSPRYGTAGLEAAYDNILTPPTAARDLIAEFVALVDALNGKGGALRGSDIVTTIDPAITRVLAEALAAHGRGAGVVLEPRSGAVLAMVSIPSYDPNKFEALWPTLRTDAHSPLLNRATEGLYPPGSTFKVFTASAALDAQVVTTQSTFTDPGYLHIGNATIHNDEGEVTGTQDLAGAFALSSNVDFAQIALKMGVPVFYDYLHRYRFGETMNFQLPIAYDRFSKEANVYDGILAQMGFGQADLLVTPLRMALVAATIANGGIEPRPYIVRNIRRSTGTTNSVAAIQLAAPISADTAAEMKNLMIQVVKRGTGTAAAIPGVTVAGKTGTATNPAGRSHAWFVAFAPAEDPKVAVAVVVENVGYGGTYAAPIARAVIRAALQVKP